MIIEIMLIILAIISVIVNTIVSVIIIKDTLNNRRYQDRIDKQIAKQTNITDKDFSDGLADHTYVVAKYNDAVRQANQNAITTIAPNNQKENNQNGNDNGI